ncbi:MAG: SpoIIE family protein phosphatase [Eubacteriales bacterium]
MSSDAKKTFYIPTYEKVINAMHDLVCVTGKDGRIILVNSTMTRVLGVRIGDDCPYTGADHDCADTCKLIDDAKYSECEITRSGRVYSVSITPLLDDHGHCDYLMQVWRDVTGEFHLRNKLQKQNDVLRKDLEVARSLQHSMLIDELPKAANIKISTLYKPCDSVGGDFYDFFKLGDDKIFFYMADVSGHGVSAAMLTVFFAQAVSQIMYNRDKMIMPHKIVKQVWSRFLGLGLEEHLYITAWVGVLDGKSGELDYCNAGHISSPVIATDKEYKRIEMTGFPICRWTENPEFQSASMKLEKGTKLLLFTDGLTDALRLSGNKVNVYGGVTAAEDIAISHLTNDDFDDCLNNIWTDIRAGMGSNELNDDVAMLMMEYK